MPTMDTSPDDPQTFRIRKSPSISAGTSAVSGAPSRTGKRKLSSTAFGSSPSLAPNATPPLRSASPPAGSKPSDSFIPPPPLAVPSSSSTSSPRSDPTQQNCSSQTDHSHTISLVPSHSSTSLLDSDEFPRLYPRHPIPQHETRTPVGGCPNDANLGYGARSDSRTSSSSSSSSGGVESSASSSLPTSGSISSSGLHGLVERRCHNLMMNQTEYGNEDRRDPRSLATYVVVPLADQPVSCGSENDVRSEPNDQHSKSQPPQHPTASIEPRSKEAVPSGLAQSIGSSSQLSSELTASSSSISIDRIAQTSATTTNSQLDCASVGPPSTPVFPSYFFATPSPNQRRLPAVLHKSQGAQSVDSVPSSISSCPSPSPSADWLVRRKPQPSQHAATLSEHRRTPVESENVSVKPKNLAILFPSLSSRNWGRTVSSELATTTTTADRRHCHLPKPSKSGHGLQSDHRTPTAVPTPSALEESTLFQLQPVPACKRRKLQASSELDSFATHNEDQEQTSSDAEAEAAAVNMMLVERKQQPVLPPVRTLHPTFSSSPRKLGSRLDAASASPLLSSSPSVMARPDTIDAAQPTTTLQPTDTSPVRCLSVGDSLLERGRKPSSGMAGIDTSSRHNLAASSFTIATTTRLSNVSPPALPQPSNRPSTFSIKKNADLSHPLPAPIAPPPPPPPPPPSHGHTLHPNVPPASGRKRASRMRRAQSVPNMRAKATLDISVSAQHRLILPPQWANFIASHGRSAAKQSCANPSWSSIRASGNVSSSKGYSNNLLQFSGSTSSSRSRTVFTPSLHPPITRQTLRELDLFEILKNPQLRHDVVFDPNVQFRPNFDGERGRRKREAGEQYWTAVVREIETGCTCTAFEHGQLLPCTCSPRDRAKADDDKLAAKPNSASRSRRQPVSPPSKIPSRIPLLVQELRAICLSILPSNFPVDTGATTTSTSSALTTSSTSQGGGGATEEGTDGAKGGSRSPSPATTWTSGQPSAPTASGPSWATTHHALIAQTLDPHLISQELEHGVLDVPALISFMGSILKLHCAPMRDEAIEKMVDVVCVDGDIGKGLRLCFEILELMKLDIANHQLRSTRPYLVETAVEFEIRWFRDQIEQGKVALDRTSSWFILSLERVRFQHPGDSRSELVTKAFLNGLLKLIFDVPSSMAVPLSPAPVSSPSSSSLNHTFASYYPETYQFDAYRMMTFHNDVADLTIVYMLLLLFRQLACSAHEGTTSVRAEAADLAQRQLKAVKGEIWCLLNDANLCLANSSAQQLSTSSGRRTPSLDGKLFLGSAGGFAKLEHPRWRRAMQNVLLQIAVRASAVQIAANGPIKDPTKVKPPAPSAKTQALLNSWMNANLCVGSPLHKLCQGRLQEIALAMLGDKLNTPSASNQLHTVDRSTTSLKLKNGHKRANDDDDEPDDQKDERKPSDTPKRVKTTMGVSKGAPLSSSSSAAAATSDVSTTDLSSQRHQRQEAGISGSAIVGSSTVSSTLEASLTKAGLDPFAAEIRLLCDRIAKVATFHLRVFRNLYEKMESENLKNGKPKAREGSDTRNANASCTNAASSSSSSTNTNTSSATLPLDSCTSMKWLKPSPPNSRR